VAVPNQKLSDKYALQLSLHSWARSYWRTPYRVERDSIVVAPHDFHSTPLMAGPAQTWWYGYHSNYGTLRSFKSGAIQPYTERRILWMLDWVMKKWPVDKGRILVTSMLHRVGGAGPGDDGSGCGGALHLAFRHPDLFASCLPGGGDPVYANDARASMQALWGKPEWALKTADGKNVWDELDLPRLIESYKPGADLPLVTFTGRAVPKDVADMAAAVLDKGGAVIMSFGEWGGPALLPVSATGTWPGAMIRMGVRKDRLLPTFSRGQAQTFRGAVRFTALNQGYRFDAAGVVDQPNRVEVAVWREGRESASADVTLTRVQNFKVVPGKTYAWQLGGAGGEVAAGNDGLLTIQSCPIPSSPTKLIVTAK
jgi:hypothetical protein